MNDQVTTETISDGSYITTLLQRLVSERLLVDLALADSKAPLYTTTLLQISPNEGHFLLDDIFPQETAGLAAGSTIQISARLSGAELSFTTTVQEPLQQSALRLWRVALPQAISYKQPRNQHRVAVAPLKIVVRLFAGEGVVVRGLLTDLGTEGIGIRVAKAAGLKRGRPYRCSIDHSEEESVEVEVVLTRAVKVNGPLAIELGAQLHNMSGQDSAHWRRFVAEIERRLLRNPHQG